MFDCFDPGIEMRIRQAEKVWLFLDYDGTLADFAPTPDDILPDPALIDLVTRLIAQPRLRVTVISGRRLAHISRLLPVRGALLAGAYGVELQRADGSLLHRVPFDQVRPTLELIGARWRAELSRYEGFYFEDKGWAIAIHGKDAQPGDVERLLPVARRAAEAVLGSTEPGRFRILGGDRFLEVCPMLAHKGETVRYLLEEYPLAGALPLYLGDDDKDADAFGVIRAAGGLPVIVGQVLGSELAACRLESPAAARMWLAATFLSAGNAPER